MRRSCPEAARRVRRCQDSLLLPRARGRGRAAPHRFSPSSCSNSDGRHGAGAPKPKEQRLHRSSPLRKRMRARASHRSHRPSGALGRFHFSRLPIQRRGRGRGDRTRRGLGKARSAATASGKVRSSSSTARRWVPSGCANTASSNASTSASLRGHPAVLIGHGSPPGRPSAPRQDRRQIPRTTELRVGRLCVAGGPASEGQR